MKRKNMTRNALFTSILSLLLCVSMLVGTTFAWFTDEVKSGTNVIAAGNLDVELYHSDGKVSREAVTGETKLFDEVTSNLWEPGALAYENFEVVNAGTLALKYEMSLKALDQSVVNGNKLGDVIKVGFKDGGFTSTTREGVINEVSAWTSLTDYALNKNGVKLTAGGGEKFGLVLYWQPNSNEIDNRYNVKGETLNLTVGIELFATQIENESDSFGNDYDKDAPNQPVTATEVADAAELKEALANGGNVVLADDIALTSTLLVNKDAVIDLNGNTMTAPSSGAMFQSQSNAAPSMTISSSEPGAEINVTGGDTSVLLGYGSTVISNVTINVKDCDSSSPNPFKVYGDLTLGEGTVVNVDYLGTALINNNGAVDIVINGAKINVGTFKTNGTAIITLNNASTLVMKNTDIKIDEFVLSSFGGDSLVSKVDGVTIDGSCTFDVTDSNGASCTFKAENGKIRLVQK